MSQSFKSKQPIFGGFDPNKISPKQSPSITLVSGGGRSAAISSMIKKTEVDLISSEKNPFGNYRNMLSNNMSSSPINDNAIGNNINAKIEDIVIKKLGEYKEILSMEFKKNLSSLRTMSEEDKKDLKYLKDNFKIQQSKTDQIMSHINQFTQALAEINTLMSSHSEILNKINVNSTEKNDSKPKFSIDDIVFKQVESKVKTLETQMNEARMIIKQLNESLLIDIKENFKKNLSKVEYDQELLRNKLKESDKIHNVLQEDIKETKTILIENKRKFEEQNREFNGLSAHLQSELLNFSKKNTNEKESNIDPKWAEKVIKMEADLDMMIKRNQGLEKKIDDFFYFKHSKELSDINDKYEELKKDILKINEKISQRPDSPEPRSTNMSSGIFSPQKSEVPIIDDKRFNTIIEQTQRNIDLALSNSPLKLDKIEKNYYDSPPTNFNVNKNINIDMKQESNMTPPPENNPKQDKDNIEDWYSKFRREKLNLESDIAFKDEPNKYDQFLKTTMPLPDLTIRKFSNSEGKEIKPEKKQATHDDELMDQHKESTEEKELDRSKQPRNSLDDYGVHYLNSNVLTVNADPSKDLITDIESINLKTVDSNEIAKETKENIETNLIPTNVKEGKVEETIGNDEIVYHLDEEGFLMDEHGNYIVDENEQMIKLSEEHIDYLRKSNMIEDDKKKETN